MLTVLTRASTAVGKIPEKAIDRSADVLSGAPVAAWLLNFFADLNIILETLTLTVGLVAGIFALFYHYTRWRRERKELIDRLKQVMKEVEEMSDE